MNIQNKALATFLACGLTLCLAGTATAATNSNTPNKVDLLAPWQLLQKKLAAVLESDPCVKVGPVASDRKGYNISINVCEREKAEALATFIKSEYNDWGTQSTTVEVLLPNQTPALAKITQSAEEAAQLLTIAFTGNSHFAKTWVSDRYMQPVAIIEFTPSVVQYHSDDISDWHLRTTLVAAHAFKDVMNFASFSVSSKINIFATTSILNPPTHTGCGVSKCLTNKIR